MILGIDACNIKSGGGITHLKEMLNAANPPSFGFDCVAVWSSKETLMQLDDRPWLLKIIEPVGEAHCLIRTIWQKYSLPKLAKAMHCDIFFVPGGWYFSGFKPTVTMSQNLLPFMKEELWRYGVSASLLRLLILRVLQSRSFRKAQGVIFLTRFAREVVLRECHKYLQGFHEIIPHGVSDRFFLPPRPQKSIREYSEERPFRLIYVSTVDIYKHQWCVAKAVAKLREEGLPLVLELIGSSYRPALRRLYKTLRQVDPTHSAIMYVGEIPYQDLHRNYAAADLCVFASSCENMPNILLESMASGLPIACSNRGPMPEVLRDAGLYFDPEDPENIVGVIRQLTVSPELRFNKAQAAYRLARQYTWKRCADETFGFFAAVATHNSKVKKK